MATLDPLKQSLRTDFRRPGAQRPVQRSTAAYTMVYVVVQLFVGRIGYRHTQV